MRISAIGGGSVSLGETKSIDRAFLEQVTASPPRVLFVPTASGDSEEYIEGFQSAYASYGAIVSVLRLHSEGFDPGCLDVDAVYVGGGNTKMMLELWRGHGVDTALRNFANMGRPVGGLSAGAICWFELGNSDWPQYEGIPGVNTAPLSGLGWVPLAVCPHTLREAFRLEEFQRMMDSYPHLVGIGLDDGCAIQIVDDDYRLIASIPDSVAHRIFRGSRKRLLPDAVWRPLADLGAR